HWTRYGPWWRRRHKVEDQPAVGSHGTNQSDYASRRPGAAKKTKLLHRSLLAAWLASSRALQAARINCGTLERRLLVDASRYSKFQCGGLDRRQLIFDRYHSSVISTPTRSSTHIIKSKRSSQPAPKSSRRRDDQSGWPFPSRQGGLQSDQRKSYKPPSVEIHWHAIKQSALECGAFSKL